MPTAEIITIGTELLLGEAADTNTHFIARTLRGLGVDLFRTQTIGDNIGRIAETVRQALERAEIVITTGGLGPTIDDPTRQAIADAVGVELEFRPELWEQIVNRIARYGRRTPTENQKRQAFIPKGAKAIENPVGTAPAFIVETPQGVIISLPGVPREMETLLTDAVVPYLQTHFNLKHILRIRTLHVSGLGEGTIDDQISDLELLANPTVGLTAHSGVVDIRIAAKSETVAEAERMIAKIEQELRIRLGDNIFGADEDTLEGVTLEALSQRDWTLACLESGLDGALLKRLAQAEHPAYRGGSSRQVREETLAQAVETVRQECNTTVALGVLLSISGEQQDIYISLSTPSGQEQRHLMYGGHSKNAPLWAVNNALDWLRRIAQEAS